MSNAQDIRDIINKLNSLAESLEPVAEAEPEVGTDAGVDKEAKAKEASVITKMTMLARNGLVDRKDVSRLITAFRALEDGRPLGLNLRLVLLQAMKSLTDLIGDDPTLVSRIRQDLLKTKDDEQDIPSPEELPKIA